ncbi:unnamed protein product [Closterium sp. NIES-64]|nr:unnamed protein product [Closterium sp. NIES-64]
MSRAGTLGPLPPMGNVPLASRDPRSPSPHGERPSGQPGPSVPFPPWGTALWPAGTLSPPPPMGNGPGQPGPSVPFPPWGTALWPAGTLGPLPPMGNGPLASRDPRSSSPRGERPSGQPGPSVPFPSRERHGDVPSIDTRPRALAISSGSTLAISSSVALVAISLSVSLVAISLGNFVARRATGGFVVGRATSAFVVRRAYGDFVSGGLAISSQESWRFRLGGAGDFVLGELAISSQRSWRFRLRGAGNFVSGALAISSQAHHRRFRLRRTIGDFVSGAPEAILSLCPALLGHACPLAERYSCGRV